MKLKTFIILATLVPLFSNCSNKQETENSKETTPPNFIDKNIEVKIALNDTIYQGGEKIELNIKLTNSGNQIKQILFDKPHISTGGPWYTSLQIIDTKTNASVIKHSSKVMLSSQVFTNEEIEKYYHNIRPSQSIEGNYNLYDLAVFNNKANQLEIGAYEIQLFYKSIPSNKLRFQIKNSN